MTIGLRLFLSSAGFALAIALVYGLTTHDPTGTVLLGIMTFALTFAAWYMRVAEREADLWGDAAGATMGDGAGESVGVYTTRSVLPIGLAASIALIAVGLIVSATLVAIGFTALLVLLGLMIAGSR
jgi:hypothetical protein